MGFVSSLLGGLFGGGGGSTVVKAADPPAVSASSGTADAPKPTDDTASKDNTRKRKATGKSSLTIDAATASSGGTGVNV